MNRLEFLTLMSTIAQCIPEGLYVGEEQADPERCIFYDLLSNVAKMFDTRYICEYYPFDTRQADVNRDKPVSPILESIPASHSSLSKVYDFSISGRDSVYQVKKTYNSQDCVPVIGIYELKIAIEDFLVSFKKSFNISIPDKLPSEHPISKIEKNLTKSQLEELSNGVEISKLSESVANDLLFAFCGDVVQPVIAIRQCLLLIRSVLDESTFLTTARCTMKCPEIPVLDIPLGARRRQLALGRGFTILPDGNSMIQFPDGLTSIAQRIDDQIPINLQSRFDTQYNSLLKLEEKSVLFDKSIVPVITVADYLQISESNRVEAPEYILHKKIILINIKKEPLSQRVSRVARLFSLNSVFINGRYYISNNHNQPKLDCVQFIQSIDDFVHPEFRQYILSKKPLGNEKLMEMQYVNRIMIEMYIIVSRRIRANLMKQGFRNSQRIDITKEYQGIIDDIGLLIYIQAMRSLSIMAGKSKSLGSYRWLLKPDDLIIMLKSGSDGSYISSELRYKGGKNPILSINITR